MGDVTGKVLPSIMNKAYFVGTIRVTHSSRRVAPSSTARVRSPASPTPIGAYYGNPDWLAVFRACSPLHICSRRRVARTLVGLALPWALQIPLSLW